MLMRAVAMRFSRHVKRHQLAARQLSSDPSILKLSDESISNRFILTADSHFSAANASNCESLLKSCLVPLAREHDAAVIIAGDVFHRYPYSPPLVHDIGHIFSREAPDVSFILLVGNHDLCDETFSSTYKYKDHALRAFDFHPNVHVIDQPTMINNHVGMIPFYRDQRLFGSLFKSMRELNPDFMIGHVGLNGAKLHQGAVSFREIDATTLDPSATSSFQALNNDDHDELMAVRTNHLFLGHFHAPQELKSGSVRATYIGSPYHQNRGEAGQDSRVILLKPHPDPNNGYHRQDIPILIGRRYEDVTNEQLADPPVLKAVLQTLKDNDSIRLHTSDPAELKKFTTFARKYGKFEIVPDRAPKSRPKRDVQVTDLEHASVFNLAKTYLDQQEKKGEIDAETKKLAAETFSSSQKHEDYPLPIEAVKLLDLDKFPRTIRVLNVSGENYKSFVQPFVFDYDANQGIFAVTGRNTSDRGQISNGSGKTAFAQLFFDMLNGPAFKRTAQAIGTAKKCQVSLECLINSVPVLVTRTGRTLGLTIGSNTLALKQPDMEKALQGLFRPDQLSSLFCHSLTQLGKFDNPDKAFRDIFSSSPIWTRLAACEAKAKEEYKSSMSRHHAIRMEAAMTRGRLENPLQIFGLPTDADKSVLKRENLEHHVEQYIGKRLAYLASAIDEELSRSTVDDTSFLVKLWDTCLAHTRAWNHQHAYNREKEEANKQTQRAFEYEPLYQSRVFEDVLYLSEMPGHNTTFSEEQDVSLMFSPFYYTSSTAATGDPGHGLRHSISDIFYKWKERLFEFKQRISAQNAQMEEAKNLRSRLVQLQHQDLDVQSKAVEMTKLMQSRVSSFDMHSDQLCQTISQLFMLSSRFLEQQDQLEAIANKAEKWDKVVQIFSRKGLPQVLFEYVVGVLNEDISDLCEQEDMFIEVSATKKKASAKKEDPDDDILKINVLVTRKGKDLGSLSSGETQKVYSILSIALERSAPFLAGVDCNVILHDETLSGALDPTASEQMYRLLERTVDPSKTAFVVCQHDSVVDSLARMKIRVEKDFQGSRIESIEYGI